MLRRALQTTRGRLTLLLGAVGLVLVGTAALSYLFDDFKTFGDSLWSATEHLLDPSTLQDDHGASARTIGLFQVITGLVLLVGLLFAVVGETVSNSLERLGQFDPPVHVSDHVLILGGTDLVGEAVSMLARLSNEQSRPRNIVVLAPESARSGRAQLLSDLRERADGIRVDLLIGDTSSESGFELGAAEKASTILVMPASSGPVVAEAADVEVVQSGLALKSFLEKNVPDRPPLVRLLFRRGRNVDAAWDLFPHEWDAVVGDRVVAAIVRLAISRPELTPILPGISESSPIRAVPAAGLAGLAFADLADRIEDGLPVGVMDDPASPRYAPAPDEQISDGQRVIVIGSGRGTASTLLPEARDVGAANGPQRIAMVGCGINASSIADELSELEPGRFELTVLAPRTAYENYLGQQTFAGLEVRLIETTVTIPDQIESGLAKADPQVVLVTPTPTSYDLRVSDAGAILSVLHVLRLVGPEMPVLAEMFLTESAARLPNDPRLRAMSTLESVSMSLAFSILDTPAAVALEHLFGGATQMETRPSRDLSSATNFAAAFSSLLSEGTVPFGIRHPDGTVTIAPRQDAPLSDDDELIVLRPGPATGDAGSGKG